VRVEVLDHGYVEMIETWGTGTARRLDDDDIRHLIDDERGIIEAARQSTQGSFRGWDQDAKLLKFLFDNKHATPFEFAGMVIEVQAPIFVFREWHRHRTQSYNEMSARYSPLPDSYYMPDELNAITRWKHGIGGTKNKQAQASIAGMEILTSADICKWLEQVESFYTASEQLYQHALSIGVPKELARITMPVGHYSRMRAFANLRNWLAFLTLRMDPAAQWEIRQFANAVGQCVAQAFPQTWALFSGAH
jgi:thymidylate synthase (FAD)